MSLRLYELADSYINILNMVDEEQPDIDILNALSTIEDSIETKAVNIANLIKSLDTEAEVIKAEVKRLIQRRMSRENASERIKKYLQSNLELLGKESIKSPTRSIYFQKNPPSVEIINIDLIPQKYLNFIPASYEPKKAEITKAWKEGEEVPGILITQGRSIRIR